MIINPFDPKAALLARHAQHVVLIHFPIALFIAGAAFDFLSQWKKHQALAAAAFYNLFAAALTTLPVLITGILAWQFQLEGQKLKGILLLHLLSACVSSALLWVTFFMHWRARRQQIAPPAYRLPIEALAVVLIAITGHLGGFLSGVNGPG